ncbi:hypothetical protein BDV93DRAFT_542260 [Ceratobasidium sp. AG-I]|nr:hypothetical protein BDV93DRAFT_542260 [Ceratobasidium sp. AG-I]
MFFKELEVWISCDNDDPLNEYQVTEHRNVIECWIIAEEGKNFSINWEVDELDTTIKGDPRAGCGISCTPWLEGEKMAPNFLEPRGIHEVVGKITGEDSSGEHRLFSFGRKCVTDDDEKASPTDINHEQNTIKAVFRWLPGLVKKQKHQDDSSDDDSDNNSSSGVETRVYNEKALKHSDLTSAQLSECSSSVPNGRNSKRGSNKRILYHYDERKAREIPAITFLFHFGSEAFLKAEGKLAVKKIDVRSSRRIAARAGPAAPPPPSPPPHLQANDYPKEEPKEEPKDEPKDEVDMNLLGCESDSDIEIIDSFSERMISEPLPSPSSRPSPEVRLEDTPAPKVEHDGVASVNPSVQQTNQPAPIGQYTREPNREIRRRLAEQLEAGTSTLAGKRRESLEDSDAEDRIRILTLRLEKASSNEMRLTEQVKIKDEQLEIKDERIEELLQEMEELRQKYKLVLRHIGDVEGQPAGRTKKRKGHAE